MPQVFTARWIVPVDAPPIERGAIAVQDGRIMSVGSSADFRGEPTIDYGGSLLVPGFINPHTHLELTGYHGRVPRGPLWDWFAGLMELRRRPEAPAAEKQAVAEGARLSMQAGVTCVGDISRTAIHVDELASSPIRKVCYIELISGAVMPPNDLPSLRQEVETMLPRQQTDRLMVGVSPHTPYTVLHSELAGCAELAAEFELPLTMHVLETREEAAWLRGERGRLDTLLETYDLPTAKQPHRGGAVERLREAGVLDRFPLLAHMNYATQSDVKELALQNASVVWCPRAHAFFGHADYPLQSMLDAGINVCVGTDSLASNESLSILDELRFVRRHTRAVNAHTLLEMGTVRGARALGLEHCLGGLTPGKWADFAVLPLDRVASDEPLANLLDAHQSPCEVRIAGERVWPNS